MDAQMDAQPVASGNTLDFGPRSVTRFASMAEWADANPVEAAELGTCAECGGFPYTGEYGSQAGPVVSQLDAPSGRKVKRCAPCWEQIMTGAVATRVEGSHVSAYFAANRQIGLALKADPVDVEGVAALRALQSRIMADVNSALYGQDAPSA